MNEYPKQMRHESGLVATVFAAPDSCTRVPVQWPDGSNGISYMSNFTLLPSPDDEVEVVVKMTRKQRDDLTMPNGREPTPMFLAAEFMVNACRAHQEAEA